LQVLTSTGAGTNGSYDVLSADNALGIDDDYIDVTGIEQIRDDYFPGTSWQMAFIISKKHTAKDWLEKEIFKPLNLYPCTTGGGKFTLKVFKPPLAYDDTQTFDEDNIVGIPDWDANLDAVINEVEFHYGWDDTDQEFDHVQVEIDAVSLNNRGPGKKPVLIKTKGLATDSQFPVIYGRIFERYATPTIKIKAKCLFSQWLSEAGDIVSFTHSLIPDLAAGTRGITGRLMEITNRSVDWQNGSVTIELLDTAFGATGSFGAISPAMTVSSGTSATVFSVSSDDAAKFTVGWSVDVFDARMREQATNQEITDITGTQITVSPGIGATPQAGWIAVFTTTENQSTAQLNWANIRHAGAVASATSSTVFDMSSGAAKFSEGETVRRADSLLREYTDDVSGITITDITGAQITVSPAFDATPTVGDIIQAVSEDLIAP